MNPLAEALHAMNLIGRGNALRAVRYAAARGLADRRLVGFPTAPRRVPGMLERVEQNGSSVRAVFADAFVDLRFSGPGRVAVGWDGALAEPSYAVTGVLDGPAPQLEPTSDGWLARGDGICVSIHDDGSLAYFDAQDRQRRRDGAPQFDGAGWSLRTELPEGAGVHGLGGRAVWDLRGGSYRCWNTDPGGAWLPGRDPLYVTTPVSTVLDDVGAVHCFIDNHFDATIDVGSHVMESRFVAGPARWHIAVGSLPEVVQAFSDLTGRPTAPPRWALGHHQARWGYASSDDIRQVWQQFRANDLPLSAIHFDIDYMVKFQNFTFNENFRDAPELIAEMLADDVRAVVIVDAGTARAPEYDVYVDGLARDAFCRTAEGQVFEGVVWPGPTVFPDYTRPDVRQWWGEQFAFFTERGVGGFWHDMNEPACFAAFGEPTFPLSTRHDLDGIGGDHRAAHNIYGLQMCRASYEGLRLLQPDRRPFLFSRSGWAGMQRYGGQWSGDIEADWSSLRGTLHQAFAYGLSGVGYYGSDIGGFTGQPSPELFVRWFQLASFMPFFRTHCAFHVPRREPWQWGEEAMGLLREALRRRYRLLPYWYTLALAGARDGAPYLRPLAWLDPALRAVDDAFLVGDDVLVAPVLAPGARRRRLALPGVWYHGETGERHEGICDLPVAAADTPWFIRPGAVVPTEVDGVLVLLVAPPEGGAASGGRLLTDAGDGWEAPHEERYDVTVEGDEVIVERHVVAAGHMPFAEVRVRRVDGGPVRLIG